MRGLQFPWDTPAAPAARSPLLDPPTPKAMGRRPASATLNAVLGMAPNWLFHHLTVVGPAEPVAAFAVAARGAGVTPWRLDFAAIEEEVFAQAVAQPASRRNLTVEGCRILARQFRERVERRQARAADLVGHSIACPLDLHALLPVPEAILVLGPTHLPARAWLAAHWGITDRLRQVAARGQADDRTPAAQGARGDRLQLLHRRGNPARCDHRTRDTVFAGAVRAAAAAAGLTHRMEVATMARDAAEDGAGGLTQGPSPHLTLAGFSGPLDHLLTLARAQQIDLSQVALPALVDQLVAAMRATVVPLGQKADWVVMAAWLVQLRSRLLLPKAEPAQLQATAEADQLRDRLVGLQTMQALAGWLERRPQLGHAVFARGRPEVFGVSVDAAPAIDVVEFLWASLALFDDTSAPETAPVYRPLPFELYAVAEAKDRILQRLAAIPEGAPFERFLPVPANVTESDARRALRRRSGWASTLVAGLELAKQGDVRLEQGEPFQTIQVAPA